MSTPTGYYTTGEEATVMVTDQATGGTKGRKVAQLGAIDAQALYTLAEVAGSGADKYSRDNYLAGYDWSLSYDALQRHALKWAAGQNRDDESGLPHMAHVAWHALALVAFELRDLGRDDRHATTAALADLRDRLAAWVSPGL